MEMSPSSSERCGRRGTYILLRHTVEPQKDVRIPIHINDEFDIGRADIPDDWNVNRMIISTHHLRFHCVGYEDDGEEPYISPMVYFRVLSSHPVGLERPGFNSFGCGDPVRTTDGNILLNHLDVLQLTPTIRITFMGIKGGHNLDDLQRREIRSFGDQYHVSDRLLGRGGQASVFVAVKQSTRRQLACKVVPVTDPTSAQSVDEARIALKRQQNMTLEYTILKDLNHPNIISLEKVYFSDHNVYIFQELITGGDLVSYLDKNNHLSSPQTAVIVHQILQAVDYLHDRHIVHRDIKPENVLVTAWRDGARVVLTDFGQSRYLRGPKHTTKDSSVFRMQSMVGTAAYLAPEVMALRTNNTTHSQGYSKAIDLWSVGCLTVMLLTGETPFGSGYACRPTQVDADDDHLAVLDTDPCWEGVGRKPKSFIRGCLVKNEASRLTAKQALQHDWLSNKQYAAEMQAAYQRAIQDWTPRTQTGASIVYLHPADIPPPASYTTTSRHFPLLDFQLPNFPPIPPLRCHPAEPRAHTPLPTIDDDVLSLQAPASFKEPLPCDGPSLCIPSTRPLHQEDNTATTQMTLDAAARFDEASFCTVPENQYALPPGYASFLTSTFDTKKRLAVQALPDSLFGHEMVKR